MCGVWGRVWVWVWRFTGAWLPGRNRVSKRTEQIFHSRVRTRLPCYAGREERVLVGAVQALSKRGLNYVDKPGGGTRLGDGATGIGKLCVGTAHDRSQNAGTSTMQRLFTSVAAHLKTYVVCHAGETVQGAV